MYLSDADREIILNNCTTGSNTFNACANLKVTLNNCTIKYDHCFNSCANCIIIVKGSINILENYLSNSNNNVFYIQDSLYTTFLQKVEGKYVSGIKRKLSEYYDKVQISEGNEEGTIHIEGEKGLSKDVKVTGWDDLVDSIGSSVNETVKVMTLADYNNLESVDSNVIYFIIENPALPTPDQESPSE